MIDKARRPITLEGQHSKLKTGRTPCWRSIGCFSPSFYPCRCFCRRLVLHRRQAVRAARRRPSLSCSWWSTAFRRSSWSSTTTSTASAASGCCSTREPGTATITTATPPRTPASDTRRCCRARILTSTAWSATTGSTRRPAHASIRPKTRATSISTKRRRSHSGTSPFNMKVTTVGDELIYANGKSKVITISGKDRSAIGLAGQNGTAYMHTTLDRPLHHVRLLHAGLPGVVEDVLRRQAAGQVLRQELDAAAARGGLRALDLRRSAVDHQLQGPGDALSPRDQRRRDASPTRPITMR